MRRRRIFQLQNNLLMQMNLTMCEFNFRMIPPINSLDVLYPENEEIISHLCSEAALSSKFDDGKESEKLGFEVYKSFYRCFDY